MSARSKLAPEEQMTVDYDRETGWRERAASEIDARLELPALGLALPLADVYRFTPLAD